MQLKPSHYSRITKWVEKVWIFLLFAFLIWAARYWHSAAFGLYEDDYTRIPRALTMTGPELWGQIVQAFRYFTDHGKPLHPTIIYTLATLGGRLGGLRGIYWIGYIILTINSFLFYALLKRLGDQTFAVAGTLAFCLYSADTTQAFLTHSLGLQPSLMFLLLGIHCYLSGRRFLPYLLITGVLLCYETPFPVFLAVPLLRKEWNKRLIKELLRNALTMGAILVVVTVIRSLFGESRVTGLEFPDVILTPIVHMIQGPFVSMGTYLYRPVQALQGLNKELIITMIFAFPVFTWVLWRLKLDESNSIKIVVDSIKGVDRGDILPSIRRGFFPFEIPNDLMNSIKLGFAGLIMLVLAYPLTFTVRAYAISGRDTRVHFAAIVGASILCASFCSVFLNAANTYRKKRLGVFVLAGFYTLLVSFGFVIQKDYTSSWVHQREFWTEIARFTPGMSEGTAILVEPSGLQDTRHISTNTWNLPRVLNQIYEFPSDWDDPPRVYRLTPGWQEHLVTSEGLFQLNGATTIAPTSLYRTVNSSDVIFVETSMGRLSRRTEPLMIGGEDFILQESLVEGPPLFEEGVLFDYLIQMPAE